MASFRVTPMVGVPVNPQVASLSNTAATFTLPISQPFYTLHVTINSFYTIDGSTPTADGSKCHFIAAGASIDLYANPGTTVKIISADSSTGYAYITEWSGLGV